MLLAMMIHKCMFYLLQDPLFKKTKSDYIIWIHGNDVYKYEIVHLYFSSVLLPKLKRIASKIYQKYTLNRYHCRCF
jgi:hypothetical protein